MSRTQQIADSYRAATVAGAWYGPSLADLLSDTPADVANRTPFPKANSISAILQHLLLWNERIRSTSSDSPLPKWEAEKEWAEPRIPWDDLVARWKRSRDLLEERIRSFPGDELSKQVPGRTYDYEKLLQGSVEHVIYHAGQISMVRNILRRSAV